MKTDKLLGLCIELLKANLEVGTTLDLFKKIGGHAEDPIPDIAYFIQEVDLHTRSSIEKKLESAYIDLVPKEATAGELFMFRLRIESSIRSLELLSRAKSTCQVDEYIPEYAVRWALDPLWKLCSTHWVYHTAEALHEGLPSALPPNVLL